MSVYHRGKRTYHELTRKYDPLNPYALDQHSLLQMLGFTPKASLALVERGKGNIFNLAGEHIQDLEAIDGVGPGQLSMLAAFFALLHHYERWIDRQ